MLSAAQAPPTIRSAPTGGAKTRSHAQPPSRASVPTGSAGTQLHVALLDGDHRFAHRLARAMRDVGWRTSILSEAPDRGTLLALGADVLLVDVAHLNTDAMWLTRQINDTPEVAIVACTERSSVAQRVRSLHEGAEGWITKPCEPSELLARIQAIARARRNTSATARTSIHSGEIEVSPKRYDALAGGRGAGLTTREFEVLELLARNDGVAVDRERIYAGVWGEHVPAGDRSIDIFVGRIRVKLKRISPRWRYLHTHPGIGYRFAAEPAAAAAQTGPPARRALPHHPLSEAIPSH
jgi:DNA-binding response OmpR family regulator